MNTEFSPSSLELTTGAKLNRDFLEQQRLEKIREEYPPSYRSLIESTKKISERTPREGEEKTSVDRDFHVKLAGRNQEGESISVQLKGEDNQESNRNITVKGKSEKVLGRVWVNSKLETDGSGQQVAYHYAENGKVYKQEFSKYNYDYKTNQRTWIEGSDLQEVDQEELDALNIMLKGVKKSETNKKPQK